MRILILFTIALAMLNTTGCATAITSYHVSYGEEACPLKVKADTSMGVSVRINDNDNPCDPPKENGE
ncbi:hypothetical protein [Vibrio campbellii]|uniref:hypothetical protein n=1 Tax=Vibrio campbellii TaxID=680 RepID=UPI001F2A93B8|nr:hypothetical protein [Vibrio campbellii]MCE7729638.1 hypothetical protein [Vibrio campbellii]